MIVNIGDSEMSADQTRREISQLDNDIASLEKKRADLDRKVADKTRRINDSQRSITNATSPSMVVSKQKQIQDCHNEIARFLREKADISKQIADKNKKRADKAVKLQNEEVADRKKEAKFQSTIQRGYERRISELTTQTRNKTTTSFRPTLVQKENNEQYDVFVSHAWEDKKDFVDKLVTELNALGVKVWYDQRQISWGDSMRERIDEGLSRSKFGIVVISPNYIAEGKYWTKTELDGLFQVESVSGKTILPIWHNITKEEVLKYSPMIAGRFAMTSASMTPGEIANEMSEMLNSVNPSER